MIYNAHGNYSLRLQSDILIFELKGAFNIEGVKSSSDEALYLLSKSGLNNWRMILLLDKDTMLVWEAIPEVRRFFKKCVNSGCTAIAYVIAIETQRMVVERIFKYFDVSVKCFENEKDALSWLR